MKFDLIPMLQVQRDLYDIPRGWTRFNTYIETMTGGTDDIVLPITGMNPMGKEHVAATLDTLLALGAEEVATEAIAEAEERLGGVPGQLRVGLVVADDAQGGWTNRYLTEMRHRSDRRAELKRGWTTVLLWTSETQSREWVRAEVLASLYRTLYFQQHGAPKTLRQMMAQEGLAAVFAGARELALDPEELAYTRDVIRPHLDSTNFPIVFACLYGDEAAWSVGYPTLGLSPRAGYALALAEARADDITPEAALLDALSSA